MKLRRIALSLCSFALLGAPGAAQLDLPRGGAKPPPAPLDPSAELRPPGGPRGDLAPRPGAAGALELPGGNPPAPGAPVAPPGAGPEAAAQFIFEHLSLARELHLADAAVESLAALDEAGLRAARSMLPTARAIPLLAAGRLLLASGSPEDRRAVAERLQRPLPPEVPSRLLSALLARDPVLASPAFLVSLLDHETGAMRAAARAALQDRLDPALLPLLAERLDSPRTSTRLVALELVGSISDRASSNLLASRLADRNSQVASTSARLLAVSREEGIDALLLERAFGPASALGTDLAWDRGRAYALLALAARESAEERALLGEEHVPSLLEAISSSEPIVSGAAAVALARIGFRLPASAATAWLDLEVPHALVRTGTGAVFHADFSALQRPALGALSLLSGESFGENGEVWRRWWTDHAGSFRARRAVIEVGAEDVARLRVEQELAERESWVFLGPQAERSGVTGNVVHLDLDEAEHLCGVLRAEGVLGAERPPVQAGRPSSLGRTLALSIAGQSKVLLLATVERPVWQERVERELEDARERNRWQFLYDRARFESQHAWWLAEHAAWSGLTASERGRKTKSLLLEALGRETPAAGAPLLEELALLYREPGVPEATDFDALLACLQREKTFGTRAKTLFELARVAASLASPADAPGTLDPALGKELWEAAVALPGEGAAAELERLIPDLGPEHARSAARDARASARASSVRWLASSSAPEDRVLLLGMLEDPDPTVRLAATESLALLGDEQARARLLALAREGPAAVRAAALRGLAPDPLASDPLAGERRDLALLALADPDTLVQEAGVALLAELADPGSASLLCALLARGPETVFFEEARSGLLRLGSAAEEECLRLARSTNPATRREAALLIAEMGLSSAAPLLLTLLAENPSDERVLGELAVLSGLDLAAEADPVVAGWHWWDLVVHDDPRAWLLAAAERAGIAAPPADELVGALVGKGTLEGARFLLAVLDLGEAQLTERALRDLERMLGQPLERPPAGVEARATWRAELGALVQREYER